MTDRLGHQIFNAANDNHSVNLSSQELYEQYYQGVPVKDDELLREGSEETFYSNKKAKTMLGWAEKHNW